MYEGADDSPTSPAPAASVPPTVTPVRSGGGRTVTPLAIPVLSSAGGRPSGVPPRASVMSTSGAAFAEVMAGFQDDLANARREELPVRSLPRFESRPNGARPQPPSLAEHPLAADLAALGLPVDLAVRAHGEEPYQAVLTALADLPEPPAPPDRPGDVF